jgi:hypothetical protein
MKIYISSNPINVILIRIESQIQRYNNHIYVINHLEIEHKQGFSVKVLYQKVNVKFHRFYIN